MVTKFFIVASIGLSLNSLIMYLLTEQWSVFYIAAQIVATAVVFVWNFSVSRIWVFK